MNNKIINVNELIKIANQFGKKLCESINESVDLSSSNVLEIGAGKGIFTYSVAKYAKKWTSLENNKILVENGKKMNKYFGYNVEFIHGNGEKIPKHFYNKYDLVIFSNSLHKFNVKKAIEQAILATKKNGVIWILEPNELFNDKRLQKNSSMFDIELYNKKQDILKKTRHMLKTKLTKELNVLHYSKKPDKTIFVFKKK